MLHSKYKDKEAVFAQFELKDKLEINISVLQAVKRKYQQEYDIAPSITFGGDHIALDIPEDGIMADNGWQIVPVHKACVSP